MARLRKSTAAQSGLGVDEGGGDVDEFGTPLGSMAPSTSTSTSASSTRRSSRESSVLKSLQGSPAKDKIIKKPVKVERKGSSAKDTDSILADLAQLNTSLGHETPGLNKVNPSWNQETSKRAAKEERQRQIDMNKTDLSRRFLEGLQYTPTKHARVQSGIDRAAREMADQQNKGKLARDVQVFSLATKKRTNRAAKDLANLSKATNDGWGKFMCTTELRNWFFSHAMFKSFNGESFPKYLDTEACWIREEMFLEENDWMRRSYFDAWQMIMVRDLQSGHLSWKEAKQVIMDLLADAGAPRTMFRSGISKNDDHEVVGICDLRLPQVHLIQLVVETVGMIMSELARASDSGEIVVECIKVLALCSCDCMLSAAGSDSCGKALAAIVSNVDPEIWDVDELSKAIFKNLPTHETRLRFLYTLDQALVHMDKNKDMAVELQRRLAVAGYLGDFNFEPECTPEDYLTNVFLVQAQEDVVYDDSLSTKQLNQHILERSTAAKRKFQFMHIALKGLRPVKCHTYDEKIDTDAKSRMELQKYIRKWIRITQKLDEAGDVPPIVGLNLSLVGLRDMIDQKLTIVVDKLGVNTF